MAMKLVRKKNSRGDLIRWLTNDEEMAVKNITGLRDFTDRPQHSLATNRCWFIPIKVASTHA